MPSTHTPDIPAAIARVTRIMAGYRGAWALCGGWAVDASLGAPSRDHADIDIAVFCGDEALVLEHLEGWQLVAHDPTVADDTADPWTGRPLVLPAHVHARPPGDGALPDRVDGAAQQGFELDIQFNARDGGAWVFSREPRIMLPLGRCIVPSPWGVPAVSAEVALFYKAAETRRRDERDFANLFPHLGAETLAWLREAIALACPSHHWLNWLRAAPGTETAVR